MTINNDTLYSIAQIDLGVGPVALHVPDTAGRYYVLQFVDAWTNNFAYVGHRATGTAAGDFLLVPPDWNGALPDGATVIRFPTRVGSIVGRWACSGTDDLRAVHLLQDAMTLEPLDPDAVAAGLPVPDPRVPEDLSSSSSSVSGRRRSRPRRATPRSKPPSPRRVSARPASHPTSTR